MDFKLLATVSSIYCSKALKINFKVGYSSFPGRIYPVSMVTDDQNVPHLAVPPFLSSFPACAFVLWSPCGNHMQWRLLLSHNAPFSPTLLFQIYRSCLCCFLFIFIKMKCCEATVWQFAQNIPKKRRKFSVRTQSRRKKKCFKGTRCADTAAKWI